MNYKNIDLGQFEIKSGVMRLSDPCYDKDVWCADTVTAEKGTWVATVKKSDTGLGYRCCELVATSTTKDFPEPQDIVWHPLKATFGVDTGQFGFFDDASYNDDYVLADGELDKQFKDFGNREISEFYKLCCGLTLGDLGAGTISTGVVSTSGFGDGSYSCYVVKNKSGNVVAVKAVFIGSEELEDEDLSLAEVGIRD